MKISRLFLSRAQKVAAARAALLQQLDLQDSQIEIAHGEALETTGGSHLRPVAMTTIYIRFPPPADGAKMAEAHQSALRTCAAAQEIIRDFFRSRRYAPVVAYRLGGCSTAVSSLHAAPVGADEGAKAPYQGAMPAPA